MKKTRRSILFLSFLFPFSVISVVNLFLLQFLFALIRLIRVRYFLLSPFPFSRFFASFAVPLILGGGDDTVHVPQIFPILVLFPQEDLAFDQPAAAVDFGEGGHLGGRERVFHHRPQVAGVVLGVGREGNRRLAALDGPLQADRGGVNVVRRAIPTITGSSSGLVSSGVRSRSGRLGEPSGQ